MPSHLYLLKRQTAAPPVPGQVVIQRLAQAVGRIAVVGRIDNHRRLAAQHSQTGRAKPHWQTRLRISSSEKGRPCSRATLQGGIGGGAFSTWCRPSSGMVSTCASSGFARPAGQTKTTAHPTGTIVTSARIKIVAPNFYQRLPRSAAICSTTWRPLGCGGQHDRPAGFDNTRLFQTRFFRGVSPNTATWSSENEVITETSGLPTLVASNRPPRPTSMTAALTPWRAKTGRRSPW
jgi:hypothetical protein